MRAPRLSIDRLSIELAGLSADEARRLAALVAERLAARSGAIEPRHVRRLHVGLTAPSGQTIPDLADDIVLATLGALSRTA